MNNSVVDSLIFAFRLGNANNQTNIIMPTTTALSAKLNT
ncbi:uncharacterized protein METZ01_LOCUS151248, partial [marine metagenome]